MKTRGKGKGEFSQCPITRLRKSKETLYRETSLSDPATSRLIKFR